MMKIRELFCIYYGVCFLVIGVSSLPVCGLYTSTTYIMFLVSALVTDSARLTKK